MQDTTATRPTADQLLADIAQSDRMQGNTVSVRDRAMEPGTVYVVRGRVRRVVPQVRARGTRRLAAGRPKAQSTRSSARSGDSGDDGSSDPDESEPPKRRLCAFCGRELPAGKRKFCSDKHAAADRKRRQRERDRARAISTPSLPTTADVRRMLRIDDEELARLLILAVCRCNGHHILERDALLGRRCCKCGRQRPGYGPKAVVA